MIDPQMLIAIHDDLRAGRPVPLNAPRPGDVFVPNTWAATIEMLEDHEGVADADADTLFAWLLERELQSADPPVEWVWQLRSWLAEVKSRVHGVARSRGRLTLRNLPQNQKLILEALHALGNDVTDADLLAHLIKKGKIDPNTRLDNLSRSRRALLRRG